MTTQTEPEATPCPYGATECHLPDDPCMSCSLDVKERHSEAWEAARSALDRVDVSAWYDESGGFSCTEAEALIELLVALEQPHHAHALYAGHSEDEGEDEGDWHHQGSCSVHCVAFIPADPAAAYPRTRCPECPPPWERERLDPGSTPVVP